MAKEVEEKVKKTAAKKTAKKETKKTTKKTVEKKPAKKATAKKEVKKEAKKETKKTAAKKTATKKETKKTTTKKAATKKETKKATKKTVEKKPAKKTAKKETKKATKKAIKKETKKPEKKLEEVVEEVKETILPPTEEELIEDLRSRTPDVDWDKEEKRIQESAERRAEMHRIIKEDNIVEKIKDGDLSIEEFKEKYPNIDYAEVEQVSRDMMNNDELEIEDLLKIHEKKEELEYLKVQEARKERGYEEVIVPKTTVEEPVVEEVKEEPELTFPDIEPVEEDFSIDEPQVEIPETEEKETEEITSEEVVDTPIGEVQEFMISLREKDNKLKELQKEAEHTGKERVAAASVYRDNQSLLDARQFAER